MDLNNFGACVDGCDYNATSFCDHNSRCVIPCLTDNICMDELAESMSCDGCNMTEPEGEDDICEVKEDVGFKNEMHVQLLFCLR